MSARVAALIAGVLSGSVLAHGADGTAAAASALPGAAASPHRLSDGALFVPKPVQALLGIRTEVWRPDQGENEVELLAQAEADPAAPGIVSAPQTGRVVADTAGWPLAGQEVRSGEPLARLQPLLGQAGGARRRAQLADIEQKLVIARLDVQRLRLQTAVNNDAPAQGNVYYEQAAADLEALERQHDEVEASLHEELLLTAPQSGRLLAPALQPGDVASIGQTLFQVVDPTHLRLAALTFDPRLSQRVASAHVHRDGHEIALRWRGSEPAGHGGGWRLLFEPAQAIALTPGDSLPVDVLLTGLRAAPAEICARTGDDRPLVWVHVAPEVFLPRPAPACAADAIDARALPLVAGERVVSRGAALLTLYR